MPVNRLALLFVLLLAGPGCRRDAAPVEVRMAVLYELRSLDPHDLETFSDFEAVANVYEPLTTLDNRMAVRPCLATSWESPDPLTWVFKLRPGVRFHDGSLLTSADVVHSLSRLIGDERLEARSYLASVAKVTARDIGTVVVETRWPNALLANRLHFVLIVKKDATSETLLSQPNGTGPFAVEAWRAGASVSLRRHETYWGTRPAVERATIETVPTDGSLAAMRSGRYHFLSNPADAAVKAAEGVSRYRILVHENLYLRHLAFDLEHDTTPFCPGIPNPFKKPLVREAIHLALDRGKLAEAIGKGTVPASQLVPPAVFGYDRALPAAGRDLDRARRLLAEAGLPNGFDVVLHRTGYERAASVLREQLAEVGIRVEVRVLPRAEFFSKVRRNELSFWILADGCATGDAAELLENAFHSPDPQHGFGNDNHGGYRNPKLDLGILEAAGAFHELDRQQRVQSLMRDVLEERPWIPLYFSTATYLVDKAFTFEPRADTYVRIRDLALTP